MSGHAESKSVPPEERVRQFWLRFVLYLVIGLACAYFSDWLPAGEGAKRIMTRIWGPALTASYPTTGRDQVTVMLIDDKDLSDYDEAWPVSLGFHQRRLLEMLQYQPKAVFFDIVFLDDRKDPGLDGFIDAACRARMAGVPVFIGAFSNPGIPVSRTQTAMLARRVEAGGHAVPCIEAAYLNLKIDGFDQSVWEYDLNVPPARVAHGEHGTEHGAPAAHGSALAWPSPAARLYQVARPLAAHVTEEPMALVWGTETDPVNLEWLNNELHPQGAGAPCSATWKWHRVLPVGKARPPLCPYQQVLPVRTLKRTNGLDADDLRHAIGNKYIVYGTQLQSNGDVIVAPYHGRIAGALLHAMALDNLLSFHGEPKSAGEFGHPGSETATWFTLFALLVISALTAYKSLLDIDDEARHVWFVKLAHKHIEHRPSQEWPHLSAAWRQWRMACKASTLWLLPRLMIGLATVAVIATLIGISYYWLNLGPLVWIEYALFPIAAEFLKLGREATEFLEKAWHYAVGVKRAIVDTPASHAVTESV